MAYLCRPDSRARSLPRVDEAGIGTGAGPDLPDDAGGHGGFDDVVAAVGLAGQLVQDFHVVGVGSPGGRLQFFSTGNAAGHAFTSR